MGIVFLSPKSQCRTSDARGVCLALLAQGTKVGLFLMFLLTQISNTGCFSAFLLTVKSNVSPFW